MAAEKKTTDAAAKPKKKRVKKPRPVIAFIKPGSQSGTQARYELGPLPVCKTKMFADLLHGNNVYVGRMPDDWSGNGDPKDYTNELTEGAEFTKQTFSEFIAALQEIEKLL